MRLSQRRPIAARKKMCREYNEAPNLPIVPPKEKKIQLIHNWKQPSGGKQIHFFFFKERTTLTALKKIIDVHVHASTSATTGIEQE